MPWALVSVAPGTSKAVNAKVPAAWAGASSAQTQNTPAAPRLVPVKTRIWPSLITPAIICSPAVRSLQEPIRIRLVFSPKGATVTSTFGPFTLDDAARQLCRGAEMVHLSPKAFDLLALLVHRQPAALSKSEILEALWRDTFVSEGNLAVLIKEIRDALGDSARQPAFIRTVQRFGYAFIGDAASGGGPRAMAPCSLTWGTERATLQVGENVLGRDPACGVCVDVVGVSRRHAMVT